MREFFEAWPAFWVQCRERGYMKSWLNIIKAGIKSIWLLTLLMLGKCYQISAYPLSYIWPRSSPNTEH